MNWSHVRPLFEQMFFDLGPKEVSRRTMIGVGTLYALLNGQTKLPRARTIRDLIRAIEEWNPEIYETEPRDG